jgi:putative hydrolase
MTRPPFGFSSSDAGDGEGGGQVPDLGAMLHQLGDLLSGQSGPVNWQVARQGALQVIGADAGTTAADTTAVGEAIRLADVWLDAVTPLPSGARATEAWSRRRWLEATQPGWARLVEPVASRVAGAMGQTVPEEMRAMAGPLLGMLSQVGGLMFGGQLGQALGELAGEVTSGTDIGVPLGPDGVAALLPEGLSAYAAGLDVPIDQVRLFVALREAAHLRLFQHVPWLSGHLFDAVHSYADGITIDTSKIQELAGTLDPSDPTAMQEAMQGGLFTPEVSASQQQALTRLETSLALVEGWVDVVVEQAGASLSSLGALQETMRRRRATGGPAEQTFATLVGLQLRPRRLRDAAALWRLLTERRGPEHRDELWSHPDLLPSAADLDEPLDFADAAAEPGIDITDFEPDRPHPDDPA